MTNSKSSKSKSNSAGGNSVSVGGSVSGGIVFAGNNNTISQTNGVGGDELAKLFAGVYQKIEKRKEDPDVDRDEIKETVQKIEAETAKGEEANANKVERWLENVTDMAPDIGEVVISCLTSPAEGIATVIRKIAEKAKAESK